MSAVIAVNIKDLSKLRVLADDLHYEMSKAKHINVIENARKEAYKALSGYNESYVISGANAVLKLCDELEAARNRACNDLATEVHGLGKVISGYQELERSFT